MQKRLLILGVLCTVLFLLTGCSGGRGYYQRGKKNFDDGKYEEASMYFRKAIEENPNRSAYLIDYGMSLIALGEYEQALEQFDQVYMNKNIPMIRKNNQRALRGKGIAYYNAHQYEEALEEFEEALSIGVLSELNLDILYYKGRALLNLGDYEGAVQTYTTIIEKYDKTPEAFGSRALAYDKSGDYEKSLADYEEAISLEPKGYNYYFGIYNLMRETGKSHEAEAVLTKASEIAVKTKEDRFSMAKVHYYQEANDLALSEMDEAYANGFSSAYFYIGGIHNRKKDYPTAIYYYEKFIEEGRDSGELNANQPEIPAAYNQIAYCLMAQGKYNQALDYLERGIALSQLEVLPHLRKQEIIAYENMGSFDIALEKVLDYIADYPEDEQILREEQFLITRQLRAGLGNE